MLSIRRAKISFMESSEMFEAFGVRIHASVDEVCLGKKGTDLAVEEKPRLFQWKDVPEEERPKSPVEEYYSSDVELSQQQLAYRWAGLGFSNEIAKLFKRDYLERQAERVNRRLNRAVGVKVTDAAYDEWWSNRLALLCDGITEAQFARILSGREVAKKSVLTEEGTRLVEYERPMEVDDELKRTRVIEMLQKISNLAKGKATDVVETRRGKRTTADDLRDAVRAVMSERARAMEEEESVPALPESGACEAEIIEQNAAVEVGA